jgi:hypothetical protein
VERLVDITGVEVVDDHRLRVTLEDGTVSDVDVSERAWRGVFEPLRDPMYFARARARAASAGRPRTPSLRTRRSSRG